MTAAAVPLAGPSAIVTTTMATPVAAAEDRILDGLSAAQREAVLHGDGPAADHRRRRHRARPPSSRAASPTSSRRKRARARGDPGPHLHREGGGGDGGARGPAHPLRLRGDLDRHLPRLRRPRPARGGAGGGAQPRVPRADAARADHLPARAAVAAAPAALPAAGRSHPPPRRAAHPGEPRQGRGRLARTRTARGRRRAAAAADATRQRDERRSGTSSWPPSTRRTRRCWPRRAPWTSATRSPARWPCCGTRPALLAELRARYRYVLVDEFQDTNHAQLELVRLLAGPDEPNITVVGDDDQAIYRWRGAAAANLLAFRELYPGAREVVLTENHRSTQVILDAAGPPHLLQQPVPAGGRRRHRQAPALAAAARARPCATCTSTPSPPRRTAWPRSIEERLAAGLPPARRGHPRAQQRRRRSLPARPERARASRTGSAAAAASTRARRCGCWCRSCARWPTRTTRCPSSTSPPPSSTACPSRELLRLNRYAARKNRPLLEVLRGAARRTRSWPGIGGAAREAAARLLADLDGPRPDVPRLRTGEVLYRFLQSSGLLARLAREATAEAEARVKNIARFFDVGEGLRRRGRARPRARLRGPPRPAARGGRRPRGGGGRSGRRRRPRPDRAQGQGPRVPGGVPGGLRGAEVPAAARGASRWSCPPTCCAERGRRRRRRTCTRSGGSSTWP